MATITLKVNVVEKNVTKTMQFSANMTIAEVAKEVIIKLADSLSLSGKPADHGLFLARQRKWLAPNRTLEYHDLRGGDVLDFKKRTRPLRVRMLDQSIKTVLIDESKTVTELVTVVCDHLGLSNPEEYSFLADANVADVRNGSASTMAKTLDRSAGSNGGELRWLNPDESLPEQSLADTDLVVLKKKFFYSDQNIDRNDPVQVNLVYVQSRDMIINGKIPCTEEEAAQLAALQCQVQYGNHEPDKHKPGYLQLKDFVAPEYIAGGGQRKDTERRIFQEHRKLLGLTELNAKYRYVQLCRSLKTYGVTFFLVKEKMEGKNKLVERLLGVTRDNILKVDKETKDILKTWPLTTLRRWAAAPNSFTLDFGDYADAYYSVQTQEGEQISRLIGGYIDIIISKKKQAARESEDGQDEQGVISEENIRPVKAMGIAVQATRTGKAVTSEVATAGLVSENVGKAGVKRVVKKTGVAVAVESNAAGYAANVAQMALVQSINSGVAAINIAATEMGTATQLPPIGNDSASQAWKQQTLDVNKQTVSAQVGSQMAACAALVNATAVSDIQRLDYQDLGANIATLSSNLNQIASSTKLLAALMEPTQGDKLLETARMLAVNTGKLLQSVQPVVLAQEEPAGQVRQDVLTNAQEVSKMGFQLLFRMGEADVTAKAQQELIDAARMVSTQTLALIAQGVKPIANFCSMTPGFDEYKDPIAELSRQATKAAENLVVCTTVAAPTIHMAGCQDRVWEGTLFLKDAINELNQVCDPALTAAGKQSRLALDLAKTAGKVNDAIVELIEKTKMSTGLNGTATQADKDMDATLTSVEEITSRLLTATSMNNDIVANAKALTIAATQMVNLLNDQSQISSDMAEKSRLIDATKAISDLTGKMVAAAKEASKAPNDEEKIDEMKESVRALQKAMVVGAGDQARVRIVGKLVNVAKSTAGSMTQLLGAAKTAGPSNTDQTSQMQLNSASKKATDAMAALVSNTRQVMKDPTDASAQLRMVTTARQVIDPLQQLIEASKSASGSTRDESARTQLLTNARQTATDLQALVALVNDAEAASAGLEMTTAVQSMKSVTDEVQQLQSDLANKKLKPTVLQTVDSTVGEVNVASKVLLPAATQLVQAANQGNDKTTGVSARDAVTAFQQLSAGVRGLAAASSNDPEMQKSLVNSVKELGVQLSSMITSAKAVSEMVRMPTPPANLAAMQKELTQRSAAFTQVHTNMQKLLPGQRDADNVLTTIQSGVNALVSMKEVKPVAGETPLLAQNKLNSAAAALAVASNTLVSSTRSNNPQDLKLASNQFEEAFRKLVTGSQSVMSQSQGGKTRETVVEQVRQVGVASTGFVNAAKAAFADPMSASTRSTLTTANKAVMDAITSLVDACSVNAPGVSECNRAAQTLISASASVDNVLDTSIALRSETYLECLKAISDSTRTLGTAISSVSNSAKMGELPKLGEALTEVAKSVAVISDKAARAAYLIGIVDPSSVAAVSGSVDADPFNASAKEAREAVKKLLQPGADQPQIMSAAGEIAKNTAALCNYSKAMSNNMRLNENARQKFTEFTKSIAQTTSSLVQTIKPLAAAQSDENRDAAQQAAKPLMDNIDNLTAYVGSPEFRPVAAQISPVAQKVMQPIVESNRTLVMTAQDVVATARSMCAGKIDSNDLQLLNTQVRGVSETLKSLVGLVRKNAPGQKDCVEAADKITGCVGDLDGALLQVDVGGLSAAKSTSGGDQALRESLAGNAKALSSLVAMISDRVSSSSSESASASLADRQTAAALGESVRQFAANFQPTIATAISFANSTSDKTLQKNTLKAMRGIADEAMAFLEATREAVVDPQAWKDKVVSTKQTLEKSIGSMIDKMEGSAAGTKEMNQVIDGIQAHLRSITLGADGTASVGGAAPETAQSLAKQGLTYASMVGEINRKSKKLADVLTDVLQKTSGKPTADQLGPLTEQLSNVFKSMTDGVVKASLLTNDASVRNNLTDVVRDVGGSTAKLIDSMKALLIATSAGGTIDQNIRQKLSLAAKDVSQSIAKLMQTAKEGSKGMLAVESGIQALGDLQADVDSVLIFAEAGQLDPLDRKENFSMHKDNIDRTARELVEVSKSIVSSAAAGNQDELANTTRSLVGLAEQLRDHTKRGATSITSVDKNTQQQLLNSTKAVAGTLAKLISAALEASGKPIVVSGQGSVQGGTGKSMPEILKLRDAAKDMVLNVGELLKVVKVVGDESTRGLRALDSAMKDVLALDQSLQAPPSGTALPEEVAVLAKSVAATAANLMSVSARSSLANQDELIASVGEARKVLAELFRAGHAATDKAPDQQKAKMQESLRRGAQAVNNFMIVIKQSLRLGTQEARAAVQQGAKEVSNAINSVVEAASDLIPGGYVDPNDPNVVAERELLAAAASIEAAAKKLAQLKPPEKPVEANEELPFEQQIVEAAKSIASATSALVKSATEAQRDLFGKYQRSSNNKDSYAKDGAWSEGLVSGAKNIAIATGDLCEAANAAVKGEVQRERVIAAARNVSACTIALLTSAGTKVDPNSPTQVRLKAVSKAVNQATDALVKAAENSMAFEETMNVTDMMNAGAASNALRRAQELDAQARVLQMEKELESARNRLVGLRKGRYGGPADQKE